MSKLFLFLISFFLITSVYAIDPESWDLLDEDCSDISDWSDADQGNAVSEVSPAGQFRMDTNIAPGGNNRANRSRDIGSYPDATFTIEIKLYHTAIGTAANTDQFQFALEKGDGYYYMNFASDGLFIYGGGSWSEVGTNLTQTGTWQTWRFVVNWTADTVDIYLDGILKAADFDCSYGGTGTEGLTYITQWGNTSDNRLSHIDYIKAATGAYDPTIVLASQVIIIPMM